jgi:hypothetical protein
MDTHPAHHVEDLSYAGQGAVLVDIGGDVGALVVRMPADMAGEEIEICPAAEDRTTEHKPHVAVLPRPVGRAVTYSAVFPALIAGQYDLYRKPDGPIRVTASVTGAHVSEVRWPD